MGLSLGGKLSASEFRQLLDELDKNYPWYAPGRFLKYKYLTEMAKEPRLLDAKSFMVLNEKKEKEELQIAAVVNRISSEMAVVDFVENKNRVIYGQLYIPGLNTDEFINRFTKDVMTAVNAAYLEETAAMPQGKGIPPASPTINRIKNVIKIKVQEQESAVKTNREK